MEKTISLENDPIFHHAGRLQENRDYRTGAEYRAEGVREALCDLVVRGKLDAIDLKIIEARDCSPMPTQSEVSRIVGVKRRTVCHRIRRFRSLFARVRLIQL